VISELRVRDLATISEVVLQLGSGLNVLTGETGAGKSMLVDAMSLLLGERADSSMVRPGAGRAIVEGAFELTDPALRRRLDAAGLDAEDDRLVIRREVSSDGRSRAWINGSPTTVAMLSRIGALLVDLHGQHETQSLLHAEAQRDILDAFADAMSERAALAETHAAATTLANEEAALIARRDEALRRADYLRHVVDEIDRAKLKSGEEESLDAEARRLNHAGTLGEQARNLGGLLDEEDAGVLRALGQADRLLGQLDKVDPEVAPWRELLDTAYNNLSELARLAAEYAEAVQEDPARLAEIERRRDVLFRLRQKHGATIEAILDTRRQAATELELLDTAETDLRAIAARRTALDATLKSAAGALSTKRSDASGRLSRAVNRMLPALGLPGGKFSLELSPLSTIQAQGQESVVFMVRLNEGMEWRPLARSASGGELSRLMLALKVVLARHDAVPTLIFDELDQGVGGEVGAQVGSALAQVAERRQVLVITHLPQIAARATRHLVVSKQARQGIATSDVEVIHGEDRITELARMLGDADAATARKHAETLLNST
jgi:DNA repair protein RecN (Recombination protein N)